MEGPNYVCKKKIVVIYSPCFVFVIYPMADKVAFMHSDMLNRNGMVK